MPEEENTDIAAKTTSPAVSPATVNSTPAAANLIPTALTSTVHIPTSVVTTPLQRQGLTTDETSTPQNPQPSAFHNQSVSSVPTNPQSINTTSNLTDPNFVWGTLSSTEMLDTINRAYNEVIHWRPNLFLVPPNSSGNSFVQELARLLQTSLC